jgi:hypothetical protein
MFTQMVMLARQAGFTRLYAETTTPGKGYSDLSKVVPRLGFRYVCAMRAYFAPDVDRLIYMLEL